MKPKKLPCVHDYRIKGSFREVIPKEGDEALVVFRRWDYYYCTRCLAEFEKLRVEDRPRLSLGEPPKWFAATLGGASPVARFA